MSARSDTEILHWLGLMLQREEGSHTARPVMVDRSNLVYRRCAWCGQWMGFAVVTAPADAGTVTDGICASCFEQQRAEVQRNQERRVAA